MSDVLKPPSERDCLRWAEFQDEAAARHEARGHHREATDSRNWAKSWRRSAEIARLRDLPPEQHPDQQDLLALLEGDPS